MYAHTQRYIHYMYKYFKHPSNQDIVKLCFWN